MAYGLAEVERLLGARRLQWRPSAGKVSQLLLDSRSIADPKGGLFFAIVGDRHDGHRFIEAAYRAGVRQFVVSREVSLEALPEASVLLVPDTLEALQALAAHHRRQFGLRVVGITGSNGKTIVKEWLARLIGHRERVVRSPKSYNSQVGVPLSVWGIGPEHTLGIFEAGISRMGEMARLARIIQPDIGIFTNLGPAHREGFPSDEVKLQEKMRLFDTAHTLIFCADHPLIAQAAQQWASEKPGRRLFSWSRNGQPANVVFTDIKPKAIGQGGLSFRMEWQRAKGIVERHRFTLPFDDAASLENACHCIAMLLVLGMPARTFGQRLRHLEPVDMRLSWKTGINRCALLDDAYSNDPASLRIALQLARQHWPEGPLTLVLSDFLQLGPGKKRLYAEVARMLQAYRVGRLLGVGADIRWLSQMLPADVQTAFYPDTSALLQDLGQHYFHDELIVIKGARTFSFERIVRRLEQKAHRTVLEVDLNAMAHNLQVFRRRLQPGTRLMVMVKAAGYGSGAVEMARSLAVHQVDYLGVAYADEGIELRQGAVRLPILVLNPEPASFDAMMRYHLEPEIYSLSLLDEIIHAVGKHRALSVHLKLDTGMHRLGFTADDLPEALARLRQHPNLHVQSVFSHLVASDDPQHDAFTHAQAAEFIRLYETIAQALGIRPLRHIANSGAIARFPQYHFDMVRLGIGLYGVAPEPLGSELRPVHTLKATISQIKHVPAGDTVGYARKGRVDRPSRIATISIGYADGLLRLAGNGRFSVLIRGQQAPTIGNICMDMAMVDVTDIPSAREGDEVIVFGQKPTLQDLAECLHTIPYEVLTNIAGRVKRVYWQE
ncbi:MAG: bifunctional UDP-N-acetylmuramoyl-tripeptide:D-alanyl-D-alanine ligase/alanine racemase [Saprospiraceae bacterium]|nr:bifunctional UDP-N-acetylmuramoyl-tripeptide:D-alanyl-D-alanine ligase/alanine racemase [Saprospiraceae bacterium]MDW8231036.1 bifunctional UDP-N-acetylmuramoyl-tripeptide:D-alanyl-D-alanine ligase/alanine racemase [Saprospiraceae bacterium]